MGPDNTHRLPLSEIMVVEDNPSDLKFLSDILKKAGYQVRPASDGELALRSVQAKHPDLILLDVKLPDMSGVEICRRLKANTVTNEIPVIFISAIGEANLKVRAIEGGGVDYVTKPFDPSEVLARLKTHLKIHRLQKKLTLQSEELIAEINQRRRAEEKLQKHHDNLEFLVEERTSELREREEKYRSLFESSFDGIGESSLDGKLLTCNPAYARMTGYSEAELKKLKYQDLTPIQWAEIDKMHVQQCLERGYSDLYEKERLRKDGKTFPISMRIWLRKDEQGKPLSLWGIVRDISNRKRAEKLLQENEKRFRGVVKNTQAGYFLIDKDGLYQDVNDAWLKMHKYSSPDQIIGKHFSTTQIGIDLEAANKMVAGLLEGEDIPTGEFSRHCRDGSIGYHTFTVGPVVKHGEITGVEGFIIDSTGRKQAEEALRESEEKYRSMMGAMKDAAYICSPELRIEYMNPRMISRIGHDAIGELCHKAIYNNDKKCSWCVYDQIKLGEHVEYELASPKDNRYYSVSNSPIFHTDKSTSKLTIFRDVTDTKAIEAQLRQARKMESIGTMAGGIAHDFNNLLYTITGNAELALEDIPKWNPAQANLKEIKSAGLKAAGIVRQLLNFSRKTDLELKPIGAVTVIKDALKFLRSTIPSSIEIRKHLPDAEVTILADPIQINQILMNLCINASQVMVAAGGILEIAVDTESLQEGGFNHTLNIPPGEYLKVEVSDTGPGIDPEIKNRIFDPYFTTKDVGQGSGMGLAVVHGIVKNHNGAITVASQLGEGTTFTVYFPISTEKPVKEVKLSDKIPRGDESIIFIDDEKSIATMCGQMLGRLGYEVEAKTNPTEALELFRSNPDYFDLIIADMTMPQMSGVQLSDKLKAVRSDVPVIICTGHSPLIDEEKAKTLGIEGFVMKPVVLRDIARVIRSVLDDAKS